MFIYRMTVHIIRKENEGRPTDRPWLTFSVFISLFVGFVIQLIAFGYLFTGLCNHVPDNRTYCKVERDLLFDNDENNDEPEGVPYYRGYQFAVGLTVFIELFAVIKSSCKIFFFVKHLWVPRCAKTWECCFCCGHYWFVMTGLSVCLNTLGIISVCMAVPFSDMINYIIGFRLGFGNVLFGSVKLIVWSGYSIYRKSCCPDSAYFLGSNRRISECEIETIEVTKEWNKRRHPDGTVTRSNKRETGRRSLGTRKVHPACVHI